MQHKSKLTIMDSTGMAKGTSLRTGVNVPESGIYRTSHSQHNLCGSINQPALYRVFMINDSPKNSSARDFPVGMMFGLEVGIRGAVNFAAANTNLARSLILA